MSPNDLNSTEKEKYKEVASELRCLVCQNQSIADSHASLATDLKEKIAEQIRAGKSKEEIKVYMQDRYGEFILYKPAFSVGNSLLWAAPFIALILAIWLARRLIKAQSLAKQSSAPSAASGVVGQSNSDWADQLYKASTEQSAAPQVSQHAAKGKS